MEALKNLPSYNKFNFSNFTQGLSKSRVKPYLRVRTEERDRKKPLEIVTDVESLMHQDFQREAKSRQSLKRVSEGSPPAIKISKTEDTQQLDSSMATVDT